MAQIDAEMEKTRAEVADYLREFADELEGSPVTPAGSTATTDAATDSTTTTGAEERRGSIPDDESYDPDAERTSEDREKVVLMVGNESATINPPRTLTFDVEVNSDSSLMGTDETQSVTFTLRWRADEVEPDDELRVE